MSQPTVNPYLATIGPQFSAGLDSIIAAFIAEATAGPPVFPNIDLLVTNVTNYVSGLTYLPNTSTVQMEIKSVAYSAINSFVNGQKGNYSGAQLPFINMLTGKSFTSGLTVDSLNNRILDIEDNITKSGLSVEQQTPLLLATMVAQTTYAYWITQINLGSSSAWNSSAPSPPFTYLSSALVSALANLPYWNAAATQGALIGAGSTFKGMIEETTQIVTVQIVSALTAALTIAAGKVIFLWIPRMQNNGMAMGAGCGCH